MASSISIPLSFNASAETNQNVTKFEGLAGEPITESTCGSDCVINNPPVASIIVLPSNTIEAKKVITLDGSGSTDPDPDDFITIYQWKQTSGPSVELSSTSSATTSFVSPKVKEETTLSFELSVFDTHLAVDVASVNILVLAPSSSCQIPDSGAAQSLTPTSDNPFSMSKLKSGAAAKDVPPISAKEDPYKIKALSLEEAAAKFKYQDPKDKSVKLASLTDGKPSVVWCYNKDKIIDKADATGQLLIHFPKLETLDKLSPCDQAEWNRFTDKLVKFHEAHHVQIIKDIYNQAAKDVIGKSPKDAIGILDAAAANAKMASDTYDDQTDHGATEGATLNTHPQC